MRFFKHTLLASIILASIMPELGRGKSAPTMIVDATQSFITQANEPLNQPLPIATITVPGNGLLLADGATKIFSLLMGSKVPGANLTTAQSIRDTFFMNYLVGNLEAGTGCPQDTGQECNHSAYWAVARHYPVGDPNDIHQMRTAGLALRAICSNNHKNCTPNNIYAAMIRLPAEIRPGMTVKIRYRSPKGPHSWGSIWMFSGQQISPGPNGNPWDNFNTVNTLVQEPVWPHMSEIDLNDNYGVWNANTGVAEGYQIDFHCPDIYGVQWLASAPYNIFTANQNGFVFYPPNGGEDYEKAPFDWSAKFHNLVMSWDGASNTIYEFADGKLFQAIYMEYAQAPTYTDASGVTKVQAMHLMISNATVPNWLAGTDSIKENDGIFDGWTIVVQEITAWNGLVMDPNSHKP